jgi:flagella basal body P-ring formation protein FlgA
MRLFLLGLLWSVCHASSMEFVKCSLADLIQNELQLSALLVKIELSKESTGVAESFGTAEPKVTLIKAQNNSFDAILKAQTGHELKITGTYMCLKDIPIATKKIHKGSLIKRSQIELAKFQVDSQQITTQPSLEEIVGMEAAENICAGEPIQFDLLANPILVNPGELVELIVTEKNIRIRASCICLEQGRLGEVVKLKNPKTNRLFLGLVDGPKTVKLSKGI